MRRSAVGRLPPILLHFLLPLAICAAVPGATIAAFITCSFGRRTFPAAFISRSAGAHFVQGNQARLRGGASARMSGSQDMEDIGSDVFSAKEARQLAGELVKWYHANKRDLPWRQQERWPQAPYAIWVSEIMLQQTRVATVIDYFERWMARWPTVQLLAAASEEEVNEMWSGLGYYRRARMLHQGAKTLVDKFNGQLPSTVDALKSIPGIGDYTAGAIASIAFGKKEPLVDGNVVRVLSRLRALSSDPKAPPSVRKHWTLARSLVAASSDPSALNQALMEMGATICTPKSPQCGECPVAGHCSALQAQKAEGSSVLVTDYPVKVGKAALRLQAVAVCVLTQRTAHSVTPQYLLVQRPAKGLLASLWEFPTVPVPLDASPLRCKQALAAYVAQAAAAGEQRLGAAGTSAADVAAAAVEATASRANKRKAVPPSTADTAAKKKENKNKKGSIQGAEAVELELVESGGGGGDVGVGIEYLGDIEFLFSHIRQTLKVFALSDVSVSPSSAGSIGGGAGKQAERILKDAKDAEAERILKEVQEAEVICIEDEGGEGKEAGGAGGGQGEVGVASPLNVVRWVEEAALESAALPTVMRRVLSFYKNPTAKKAVKRLRHEEVDAKQTTLSHFFSRSAPASKK